LCDAAVPCRAAARKLLLFPVGNTDHNQYLSLYLDSSPEPAEAVSLYDTTTFSLVVHGHAGAPDVRKGACRAPRRRRGSVRAGRLTRRANPTRRVVALLLH
jgi:hypothetical protein